MVMLRMKNEAGVGGNRRGNKGREWLTFERGSPG